MLSPIAPRFRVAVALCLVGVVLAACKSDSEKVADFLALGDGYAEEGQDREAVIEYRNVLQIAPNEAAAHWGLAQAYLRLGRLKDGYWELRESVRLDPDNPVVTRRLAIALLDEGRPDVALTVLDQMVEQGLSTRADTAAFCTLRARILRRLGRNEEADDAFRIATRLSRAG